MIETPQLLGAAALRRALDRHGVRPLKSLGQNFVIDPNTIHKVVAAAGLRANARVLEIGAGAGSLTLALAAAADEVIAVEKDARLHAVLQDVLTDIDNVQIVAGDALTIDIGAFGATDVVANLPYNIAATVVLRILDKASGVRSLTVMTQKEVGQRLAAGPGSKIYGQTSALVSFFARAAVAAPVSRRAFWPVPRVDSVIVRIERRAAADPDLRDEFFQVVKSAFAQRRKSVRNSLSAAFGSLDDARRALTRSQIDPTSRAEDLAPADFLRLARELAARRGA